LFEKIKATLPHVEIIAEDLGDLRPQVLELRDHFHLPGMKIVQFELPIYPPFEPSKKQDAYPSQFVAYTGTHDNQTTLGWFESLTKPSQEALHEILKPFHGSIADQMIQQTLAHSADLAIIPMQDILNLDDSARMNTPGTIGSPNWEWKMNDFSSFKKRIPTLRQWISHSNR
jgi:4-alpha-glucanotransferase